MKERAYWLGFSAFPAIGPAKFRKILEEFGTAKAAWSGTIRRLVKVMGEEFSGKFERFREEFSIEDYLKKLKEKDVWFVTLRDEDYPQTLKEIKNPPFVLYGRGSKEILSIRQLRVSGDAQDFRGPAASFPPATAPSIFSATPRLAKMRGVGSPSSGVTPNLSVAVVGARKTTQYGREVTKLLTVELVNNGFIIVSGLALGVDAISHMTALENGGKTIAVLGCGVDCCNPRENLTIYNNIVQKGCVVSEFPLGMKPTQWTFPARNRIIAGLSQAVLVTEGAEDSGSLITANFALKFGRKVFAVPGPITSSMSKGPYKLLQKGAKMVTSGEDIFKELKIQKSKFKNTNQNSKIRDDATEEEKIILKLLENEQLHFDEIVRRSKLNSSKLSSLLTIMEIKGMVKSSGSGMFSA